MRIQVTAKSIRAKKRIKECGNIMIPIKSGLCIGQPSIYVQSINQEHKWVGWFRESDIDYKFIN